MNLPRPVRKLIESFEKLPGIGPKTAQRLTFYLLHVPQEQLDEFGGSLMRLKKDTVLCSICFNVSETDPCPICTDRSRDKSIICVVEQPLDVLALEKTSKYQGVYHVLHGAIDPLNNIGPDEIRIGELIKRVAGDVLSVAEIILATNPSMEGEATAMYIANRVRELKAKSPDEVEDLRRSLDNLDSSRVIGPRLENRDLKLKALKLSRIGLGLPTGGDLEYADENTLRQALSGRREY